MKRRKVWVYPVAAVMSISLLGCGAGESTKNQSEVVKQAKNAGEDNAVEEAKEEYAQTDKAADETDTQEAPQAKKTENEQQQKLIRTITLRTETKQFDSLQETIQKKVETCKGYIESSEMNGSGEDAGDRSASYTIRIPEEQVDDFLKTTEKNTHILYRSEETEDVTLDYVDTKAHIESLRVEQDALLSMLEKATKLSDIYSIQSELADVRYQIESYESQLRTMDNKVNYTTIYLDVAEVEKETAITEPSYLEEVKERAQETVKGTIRALRSFSLWLISAIPGLILLAILFLFGKRVWKKCDRRIKEREKKQPARPVQMSPNEWAYRQQMMVQPPVQSQVPPVQQEDKRKTEAGERLEEEGKK